MPQIAVAALGAYAGSFFTGTFLGLSGAAWGWMAGSALGAQMFGPRPEDGPRITDGKFSNSVYGQPIPISYGSMRHRAQVVWWSGLHESSSRVGGSSISSGARVYSYSCDLMVSVCEGPQAAVLRIWANGRLIWWNNGDEEGHADEEVISAANVRIYLGGEDQEPDSLYEADVGTENAVAYRGQVVVMLEGMQLEFAGNRPPVIEVEVSTGIVEADLYCPLEPIHAVNVQRDSLFLGNAGTWSQSNDAVAYDSANKWLYVVTRDNAGDNVKVVERYSVSGSAPVLDTMFELPDWSTSDIKICGLGFDPSNQLVRIAGGWNGPPLGVSTTIPIEYLIKDGGVIIGSATYFKNTLDGSSTNTNGAYKSGMYTIFATNLGEARWWSHGTSILSVSLCSLRNIVGEDVSYSNYEFSGASGEGYIRTADTCYVPIGDGSVLHDINLVWRWDEWTGYRDTTTGKVEITGTDAADAARWTTIVYAPSRKKAYICTNFDGIAVMNLASSGGSSTALSRDLTEYPEDMISLGGTPFFVWNDYDDALVCGNVGGSSTSVALLDPDTMEVLITCVYDNTEIITAPRDIGDGRFACILGDDQVAIIDSPGATRGVSVGEPITLQEIVEDICDRAGLPAENLDATAGTDLVDGYKIATQSTARAAIDPLRPAYFFDMAESGQTLVLKKRGGASVATIDSGELGARVFALTTTDPATPYEMEHVQEIEVPRTLEVVYIDADMDYDNNVQSASRATGSSKAPLRLDVPVVMTADKALNVAWKNLLQAHASKSAVKLSLSHAYAALDPADPIVVPLSDGEQVRVRIERVVRARPLLEIEAVVEDASEIYSQELEGGAIGQPPTQEAPGDLSDTVLALIDTTPLRDADDSLLIYAAMGRAVRADAWSGASAYKSVDGGASYDGLYSVTDSATIGVAVNALEDWTGGNAWDDDSHLTVMLSSGTLSSATDLGVLNGMNALAVRSGTDWEIVQFADAELTSTNTWRVTRLLRGRLGTERAIAGHAAGDVVVLLSATTLQTLAYPIAEIGLERDYLAVTAGQAIGDGVAQAVTMNGNSLKPLSPVHIAGARDAGDLTITWIRRARINAAWLDLYDVPLDEPAESYEIDILDGDDVVRTLTATTTTVEYTSAQQTTDFGSPQASVSVAIYQISSRVGRGHAGTATI